MRSAIHRSFAEPADVMELGDSPIPEPGLGQVRIRMILSPIHNHDIWTVRGRYGYRPTLPAIGGSEAVGIVDAVASDVDNVAAGQRVAVAGVHGTWAEYFLAPATALVAVPDNIPDEAAAQLIAMPFSALSLLEFLNVKSGDWIIQNTANGMVGKTLAMLAAAQGVNVVNLVRRDSAIKEMAELGIGNVIVSTDGWQDRVRTLTAGQGLCAAVDSIGGQASGELLSMLADNGLLVSFGTMSGEPMQISSGDLIFKQAVVKGFWGSKVSATMGAETKRRLFTELLTQVANGTIKLTAGGIFPLEDIRDAISASLEPGKSGKILLKA